MQKTEHELRRRFQELYTRATDFKSLFCSDFLNIAEQQVLYAAVPPSGYVLVGGFESAERQRAVFGTADMQEALAVQPFAILQIAPKSKKFAEALTHRDFLGSILALGIKRELLGDIVLSKSIAYVCTVPKIAPFIVENLDRVRHTAVLVQEVDHVPKEALPTPTEDTVLAASARLDALLAAVFHLSRKEAQTLVTSGKVFLNGREAQKGDCPVAADTIVSVRGKGRFTLCDVIGTSRKGKCRFSILRYQ